MVGEDGIFRGGVAATRTVDPDIICGDNRKTEVRPRQTDPGKGGRRTRSEGGECLDGGYAVGSTESGSSVNDENPNGGFEQLFESGVVGRAGGPVKCKKGIVAVQKRESTEAG